MHQSWVPRIEFGVLILHSALVDGQVIIHRKVHLKIHTHIQIQIHQHTHIHIYVHAYLYLNIHLQVGIQIHVHVHVHMCAHTYSYTHTSTHKSTLRIHLASILINAHDRYTRGKNLFHLPQRIHELSALATIIKSQHYSYLT